MNFVYHEKINPKNPKQRIGEGKKGMGPFIGRFHDSYEEKSISDKLQTSKCISI